jgi:hypothetical protein
MADNWISNKTETSWTHKSNPQMIVAILVTKRGYEILHTHPAPGGKVILQYPEYTDLMRVARKKADLHIKHWNDPMKWTTDKDYGKLDKKP